MDPFSPDAKPAFLSKETAEAAPYVGADPDAVPRFDDELVPDDPAAPSRGIITRYREIARLHAFGKTNNQICAILGYTPSRMSLILLDPFVQAEVQLWRDRLVDDDAIGILKSAARDGALHLHNVILDPAAKGSLRMEASKFAVEKTHGKARQEVTVESGTLTTFMEMLKDMRSRGEAIDGRDVTPALPEARSAEGQTTSGQAQAADAERNHYDAWLDAELR